MLEAKAGGEGTGASSRLDDDPEVAADGIVLRRSMRCFVPRVCECDTSTMPTRAACVVDWWSVRFVLYHPSTLYTSGFSVHTFTSCLFDEAEFFFSHSSQLITTFLIFQISKCQIGRGMWNGIRQKHKTWYGYQVRVRVQYSRATRPVQVRYL